MSSTLIDPHNLMPLVHAGQLRTMRQSTIGNVEICSYREKMRREYPIGYSSSDARCLGTGYHAGLETYWNARQDGTVATPDEIAAAVRAAIEHDVTQAGERFVWVKFHNVEDMVAKAVAMVANYLVKYESHWHRHMVVGTEISFAMPYVDGFVATGTIDLVLAAPDGRHILVDHKTANRMWPQKKHLSSPQPGWYSYWWMKAAEVMGVDDFLTPHMVFEIQTYDMKFDRRRVVPTPELHAAVLEKASVACSLAANDGPWWPNTSSNLCSETYCDYHSVCPHGAQLVAIQNEAAKAESDRFVPLSVPSKPNEEPF